MPPFGKKRANNSNPRAEIPTPDVAGGPALIAVMGATGSGKTQFVNTISKSHLAVGHSLESCTDTIQESEEFELDGRRVVLIDTPGFDDTNKTDTEVLNSIAAFLENSYSAGKKLTGIVYIHRISDDKFGGSVAKNFQVFRELCGDRTLKNVVLVTNMWGRVTPSLGVGREKQLQSKHFKSAIDKGARLLRYDDTPESAQEILRTILHNEPEVLKIQQELVEEHKEMGQTGAGAELSKEMRKMMESRTKEIKQLEKKREKAKTKKNQGLHEELDEEIESLREQLEELKEYMVRMQVDFVKKKRWWKFWQ